IDTIQTRNNREFSDVMALGALAREESRGAHNRTDFPKRDDKDWLKHTMAWREDGKVKLDYKPVVITKWEPQERRY
ncbi:MAG: succinate dehydrogenase/fumarate reductase flavoprotein subunit, partial [Candidatus Thermoplasmatota archaeon]|nr:succinate dehydrogenase/fumarate reductase flavoprotein subunit [Candidatus Thermoplasmatota archaeon]